MWEHWEAHVPPRPDSCGQGLLFCSAGLVRMLEVGMNAVDLVLLPLPCLHLSFHRGHPLVFALPIMAPSLKEVHALTTLRVDRAQCSPASAFPQAEGKLAEASPDLWV